MAEALRCLPRGFETLAREHLWRKKWHILDVVAGWLRESKKPSGVQGHYRGAVRCGPVVSNLFTSSYAYVSLLESRMREPCVMKVASTVQNLFLHSLCRKTTRLIDKQRRKMKGWYSNFKPFFQVQGVFDFACKA